MIAQVTELEQENAVISAVAQQQYLEITRNAGLPDELAISAYQDNAKEADKLTKLILDQDMERGKRAQKILTIARSGAPHSSVTKAAINGDAQDVGGVAGARLKSFIERIERLEEEKAAIADDVKDVYAEAKGTGFDAKTIRKIVSLRKLDVEKRREADDMLDLYKSAIGME